MSAQCAASDYARSWFDLVRARIEAVRSSPDAADLGHLDLREEILRAGAPREVPMVRLRERLGLCASEERVLWLLLAHEMVPELRTEVRELDTEQHADLAMSTLRRVVYSSAELQRSWDELAADAPLRRFGLIERTDGSTVAPSYRQTFCATPRVVSLAHGCWQLDEGLRGVARVLDEPHALEDLILPEIVRARLLQAVRDDGLVIVSGALGSGRTAILGAVAAARGQCALLVESSALASEPGAFRQQLRSLSREACLLELLLVFRDLDRLAATEPGVERLAIAALAEPPPPPDRSYALKALGFLVQTLAGLAFGRLGHGVMAELASTSLSPSTQAALKDRLGKLVDLGAVGTAGLLTAGDARDPASEPTPVMVNPAAKTLLEEFSVRLSYQLGELWKDAHTNLLAVDERDDRVASAEVRLLLATLDAYSRSGTLGSWLQSEIAIGWMNFTASISIGHRGANESVMPGAGTVGGSQSTEWRRQHHGFVEIDVEFPDEVHGLEGIERGAISILSDGPGVARILRNYDEPAQPGSSRAWARRGSAAFGAALASTVGGSAAPKTGIPIATLPVYRRLWLGRGRTLRAPDILITPDHRLEVNTNSTLLAAIGSGEKAPFLELFSRGRAEEREQARLLAKAQAPQPSFTGELGPLGRMLETPPPALTPDEQFRFAAITGQLVTTAHDAQIGAERLVASVLAGAMTSEIEP